MRIHFIAIGGSAMHNLAIALKQKGYSISGSDDEIFEPSRSHLTHHGLLPNKTGWFPNKISKEIDAIVLGMHARTDNPELLRAKELGIKIYSYPEYLYQQTKGKTRVVIGGSHGKTTITSMIMHVLREVGQSFDYMVGAQIEGFDTMVSLSDSTNLAIFEGDEYLTSPIDPRPKFHLYKPHIAVISGIAWDHINVFPTFEQYRKQFNVFVDTIEPNGHLVYCANDKHVVEVAQNAKRGIKLQPYTTHPHHIHIERTFLETPNGDVKLKIIGSHNMENISAAKSVCNLLSITDIQFYNAIATFGGAGKRLQIIRRGETTDVFLDFAHAPSKVKATIDGVNETYPYRKLVACLELHTFSSLNPNFLTEYKNTMCAADVPIVYYNPKTLAHKRLNPLSPDTVKEQFGCSNLKIFTEIEEMRVFLTNHFWDNTNLLLMSSGNFSELDIDTLAGSITDDDSFPRRYLDI
jgi:UDP-N-acetylmuramate: L-alanyl-gamma-D-glutamyl-meso-diaminopimelate ligase